VSILLKASAGAGRQLLVFASSRFGNR
jgi:hypothetical protein